MIAAYLQYALSLPPLGILQGQFLCNHQAKPRQGGAEIAISGGLK
jgi:hypothetical protein